MVTIMRAMLFSAMIWWLLLRRWFEYFQFWFIHFCITFFSFLTMQDIKKLNVFLRNFKSSTDIFNKNARNPLKY